MESKMRIQKGMFVLVLWLFIPDLACAEWELWVVPEKRVVDRNESLRFILGVSGHGYLDPHELKVTMYSETDCPLSIDVGGELVKQEQDNERGYDIYVSVFRSQTRDDMFTRPAQDFPPGATPGVQLESETISPFKPMWVTPRSSGDKTVILILSYKNDDGTWRTVSRDFKYHVRTWMEKYEKVLTMIAVVAALIGIYLNFLSNRKSRRQTKKRSNVRRRR
jgi:hypothetical protein